MLHFSFTCENLRDVEVLAAVDILSFYCYKQKTCDGCLLQSKESGECILVTSNPEHWSREVRNNAVRSN